MLWTAFILYLVVDEGKDVSKGLSKRLFLGFPEKLVLENF